MELYTRLPSRVPVVIVGAGYAGLSAALNLHERGISALVLEGSSRVGGRVYSENRTLTVVDHGGQWVGPTQQRILAWAQQFGCSTFATQEAGQHLELWHDGTKRRYLGDGPEGAPGMSEYLETAKGLDVLAGRVRLDDPVSTPGIETLDGETVQSYFDRTVSSSDARHRLALAVQGVWSCEPRDLSLFHLLFYIASAGGFEQLMATEGGAQESRFVAGAQAPALAAADLLNDSLKLNTPVLSIEQLRGDTLVHTKTSTIRASHVVVAMSPEAASAISFTPHLPVSRRRWLSRSPMGDVAKVHVVYKEPFWREQALSGQATLYGDHPVGVTFDNSPYDASVGVLVGFVYGDRFRQWSKADVRERRDSVISTLVDLFGMGAEQVIDYTEKLWPMDMWTGGGYAAVPAPGTWYEHGRTGWRSPIGSIHWAGTETASVWNGYIDGAISSGERVAAEVIEQI